jgi:hypothetical protein
VGKLSCRALQYPLRSNKHTSTTKKENLGQSVTLITGNLVHDPRVGLQHLANTGQLTEEELEEVNQLCMDLGQAPLEPAA